MILRMLVYVLLIHHLLCHKKSVEQDTSCSDFLQEVMVNTSANREIKVAIHNVKTPGSLEDTDYGTFDVMVRGFFDDDKTMDVREDFRGCTLDPLSPFIFHV